MPKSLERLKIEGFAGIDDLELDVRPFTVLIGPQSVGKSIVAKLLFFFRSSPRNLYLEALKDTDLLASEALLAYFAKALPSPTHSKGSSKITYLRQSAKFELTHDGSSDSTWKLSIPAALRQAFDRLRSDLQEDDGEESVYEANEVAKEAYHERTKKLWPDAEFRPRFVPAGRSFYSQIERDQASYYEAATIDPFVAEFAKFLAILKGRSRIRKILPTSEAASNLGQQLLSGRYAREGSEEFIHSVDGRKLPPRLWSSGQQEAQPLILLLQRYCEGFYSPTSLFIEEPEAHLFPTSQRLITEFIALAYNARQPGMQIFVTTHSPYILTTINNLLLAGQLYEKKLPAKKHARLTELIGKDRALAPGCVGAFYMDRETCRSVIDPETDLIGSSELDSVSGSLNEQFDALLDEVSK